MGRYLALDVGDVRIGIALSDPLGIFAQPEGALINRGKGVFRDISKIVIDREVSTVVVGLPLELSGEVGERAKIVREFATGLKRYFESSPELLKVTFAEWDERFTTDEAERFVAGTDKKDGARRALRDSVAAAIILEGYLAYTRNERERSE